MHVYYDNRHKVYRIYFRILLLAGENRLLIIVQLRVQNSVMMNLMITMQSGPSKGYVLTLVELKYTTKSGRSFSHGSTMTDGGAFAVYVKMGIPILHTEDLRRCLGL